MEVGQSGIGLTAKVSLPHIIAYKWAIMQVKLSFRSQMPGKLTIAAPTTGYDTPGWSAQIGSNALQCVTNDDRVGGLSPTRGREPPLEVDNGPSASVLVEFTCGHGNEYQEGGTVTIDGFVVVEADGVKTPVRFHAEGLPYNLNDTRG